MNRPSVIRCVLSLTLVAVLSRQIMALPPPPSAPFTLWNFLGIPQGLQKVRDASCNKTGNFPGLERKPPLKALADPANLESKVKAIEAAAKIKTEEDMAPQKIKAVKYLASVGCCHEGVTEALLECLDDCSEDVRYETARAIQDAAYQYCKACTKCNGDCTCYCDADVQQKLTKIGNELDKNGCWVETSERVREAAKAALRACPRSEAAPTPAPQPQAPAKEPIPPPDPAPVETAPGSAPDEPPASPAPDEPPPAEGSSAGREDEAGSPGMSGPQFHEALSVILSPPGKTSTGISGRQFHEALATCLSPVGNTVAADAGEIGEQGTPEVVNQPREVGQATSSGCPSCRAKTAARAKGLPTPLPGPSMSESLHTAAESTPSAQGKQSSSEESNFEPARGTISRVNKKAGYVELCIDQCKSSLKVGDCLQVWHPYLFEDVEIGYVQIIAMGPPRVTAKPIGRLTLDKITRGDGVTFGLETTWGHAISAYER